RTTLEIFALRSRQADALDRGTEASQERVDGQRDDADDGDLSERIERTKIDEDHVDDVAAACLRQGVLHEERREIEHARTREHREYETCHSSADRERNQKVARTSSTGPHRTPARIIHLDPPREPTKPE